MCHAYTFIKKFPGILTACISKRIAFGTAGIALVFDLKTVLTGNDLRLTGKNGSRLVSNE